MLKLAALCLVAILPAATPSPEIPLPAGLELRLLRVTPPSTVVVELRNVSSAPLRIWRETSSWGVAHWRIMRIRKSAATLLFQYPMYGFTINIPSFDELAPQAALQRVLDLTEDTWQSTGTGGKTIEAGDLVVPFYDVPQQYEGTQRKIWHGAIVAVPQPFR